MPQLHFHAARLALGGLALLPEIKDSSCIDYTDGSALAQPLLAAVSAAVKMFSTYDDGASELDIVVFLSDNLVAGDIVHGGSTSHRIWLHILVESRTADDQRVAPANVTVEARGQPRTQASVKNTAWVKGRASLEAARAADAVETILLGGSEELVLLEGTVSNFYVVMRDGTIWTACDNTVLCGSVQNIVLDAASEAGIPLVKQAPRVANVQQFDAAFLTNAIRMLTPVDVIRFPTLKDFQPEVRLPMSVSSVSMINELRNMVVQKLEFESTALLV
jgi:Amino-transferase class IV